MVLKEYLTLEEAAGINSKRLSLIENGEAALTHYLHNKEENIRRYFKKGAVDHVHNMLILKYPENEISPEVAESALQLFLFHNNIPFPASEKPRFSFIDLFAGIGGIRMAYQNLGGKCVFTSEYDRFAQITYKANFGEVPFGDITKISEKLIPNHDILLAGFPCQPFSIAGVSKKNSLGKKHGFLDETQGTLFFDIARILKEKRPKAFMLENVKNLAGHDKGRTFMVISNTLKELNYSVHFKVMDGKHFVPQHRERIIIVGFDNKVYGGKEKFEFPALPEANKAIRDILEPEVDAKYTLTDKLWKYLQAYAAGHKAKGNGFGFGLTNLNSISRTLSARYYKDGSEILIPQEDGINPRRLTPRECARLQGFPDEFIIPVSDNQAYRQFGNSVVMPLIQAVASQVTKAL
jgi:DNA (cytosine-5)-methyltransferase 1